MNSRNGRRLNGPALGVLLFLLTVWGAFAVAALAADPAPRWERTYVLADSLVVGASWTPACDVLGCADSYRITFGFQAGVAPAPLPATDGARGAPTAPRAPTVAPTMVLLDTTVTEPRAQVKIPTPLVGASPSTVCLYITAVRRGRASTVTSGCRTVETPDADPPAVDSITWDSVPPVEPLVSRLTLDSLSDTLAVLMSKWAWRHDSTGAVIDSVLVERKPRVRIRDPQTGLILVPAHDVVFRVGESIAVCAMIPHRYEPDVAVISVPGVAFQRPSLVRRHQQMCAEALALDWPERTRIRWVSDARPGLPHPMPTDTVVPARLRAPTQRGA